MRACHSVAPSAHLVHSSPVFPVNAFVGTALIASKKFTLSAPGCGRSRVSSLIAISEFVCHTQKTTTCHHRLGDDSRLRLALTAQTKHTLHKYNVYARVPGGNGGIWAHFFFFHPYKKCAKITSVSPGSLADMLYLRVVCLFCAASARRRRESSPSRWWQVVVFGLWQTNSETAITEPSVVWLRVGAYRRKE